MIEIGPNLTNAIYALVMGVVILVWLFWEHHK